ncbi:DEAD/DEAH box helicase [Halopenitus sp. H-Gu1]|uniref:DEAD/DEAH box helicase n=1 Tax=Halopenitus sp. H-Gu1 TaxID=3242697 RepID=UPI00359E6C60
MDTGDPEGSDRTRTESDDVPDVTTEEFYEALLAAERPVLAARQVARETGLTQAAAKEALDRRVEEGALARTNVEADPAVFYPAEWSDPAARERVVVFANRREIVVDRPTQYTRARLSQFAHLVDTSAGEPDTRGYLYRIRREDVWAAPFESLEELRSSLRSVCSGRHDALEEWITDQWKRAHRFRLSTHEDGYVVLEAATESLMGTVVEDHLDEDHLRAPISETEAWVNETAIAAIKRSLYEAGYPVEDDRDLDGGEPIDVEMETELRDYQREWVETFLENRSGVFVGPPGSGKTVAALGTIAAVGGETLILVPSRELAEQWRDELETHTDLDPAVIGQYHGGEKAIRPVTIATYQTAGMDRHRHLFDSREWGLIVYDEAHHIPSPVFSRSADLQAKHRLGLSATPVRETGSEEEIYTLIGPPIGADWDTLFEAGFVQQPEVEIRYVPWRDDTAHNAYASASGRDRYRLAAENPAKIDDIRSLLSRYSDRKALVFVEYLDQGEAIAEAIDTRFVSGETPHHERQRLFEAFREGDRRTLVVSRVGDEGIDLPNAGLSIVASGLGGSRRQGTQRAGRTMRPAGSALVYVLATRGSKEEEFAQRRMHHLGRKGIRVRETNADE